MVGMGYYPIILRGNTMNKIRSLLLPLVCCLALGVAIAATVPAKASPVPVLLAQVTPETPAVVDPTINQPGPDAATVKAVENFLPGVLTGLIAKFPWLASVILFMGSMRMWAKPVFAGLHALVAMTPTKTDDGYWQKFTTFLQSPAGAWLHWLLDYVCSIKLVPPPKPVETKPGS